MKDICVKEELVCIEHNFMEIWKRKIAIESQKSWNQLDTTTQISNAIEMQAIWNSFRFLLILQQSKTIRMCVFIWFDWIIFMPLQWH